jgi:predicted DNA-binding protein (UPF0251 family)
LVNTPIDWDEFPYDDPKFLRDLLYGSGAAYFSLPVLAQLWLGELEIAGLRGMDERSGAPRKRAAGSHDAEVNPSREGLHSVRVRHRRQTFWIKLDGGRTARGYRRVEILDEPLRTDMAAVAALTALEADSLSVKRVREVCSLIEGPFKGPLIQQINKAPTRWDDAGDQDDKPEPPGHGVLRSLEFVLSLLRHYRSEFDNLPRQVQQTLLEATCERVETFLKAARQLVAFLEYGESGKNLTPSIKDANRDVEAVMLADVEDLKHDEIAQRLGILPSGSTAVKGENKTVKEMIKRGRTVLEGALREGGWRRQADAMRAEAKRWNSLGEKEQEVELLAEEWGVPTFWAREIQRQGHKPSPRA